ncbi:Carn-acyltransf domain-containing protein [Aphelenchoides bicaudatus]|nr:Carn-acyltransf domain-containing protein [Aphelenchoides bicaudatus]
MYQNVYHPVSNCFLGAKNGCFNLLYPIQPWIFTLTSVLSAITFHLQRDRLHPLLTKRSTTPVFMGVGVAIVPVILFRFILRRFVFGYKGHIFENAKRPSIKTRIWRVCYFIWQKLSPRPKLTTCDALLPKQPVPSLDETLDRYLDSMQPLLSEGGSKMISLFIAKLQDTPANCPPIPTTRRLYSCWTQNYITPFWDQVTYLRSRDCLLINSSICSVDMMQKPKNCDQATRAGHCAFLVVVSMLKFGDRSQKPLHSGQMYSGFYTRLYSNCRVPGKEQDYWTLKEYSRHLIVIANGCFYRVECFDEETNNIFTDIIKRHERPSEMERKLGSLTTDRRDKWAHNRQRFFVDDVDNSVFLDHIESAIAVFVLDNDDYGYVEGNHDTVSNLFLHMLCGDGTNRWADKPLTYVFGKNGCAGANSEHSIADGVELVNAWENMLGIDATCLRYAPKSKFVPRSGLKMAERLQFKVSNDMVPEIHRCFDDYNTFKSDLDAASAMFTDWGKGQIKRHSFSPDAFVQMAIQLAYFRDQGHFTLTYEAANARLFRGGRTETIRSVSDKSCAFVRAMVSNNYSQIECIRLLREACAQHQLRSKQAMVGQGVDRHLFVLCVLHKMLGIHSAFLDQFQEQQKWKLSTSQSPLVTDILNEDTSPRRLDQCWMGGGFGAVTKDGYGVCYRFIGNHSMVFHITSYFSAENTDSKRFRLLLTESLQEMMELFEF